MNYKSLIIILLTLLSLSIKSQDADKKITLNWHGFIKSDYWYDSRKIVGARGDLFAFYPDNIKPDSAGNDINADGRFNFSAVTTRLNTTITGPDAFGAKVSGFIEGDFSGVSDDDNNGYRIRHAYVKFNWEKSELMAGQYWHPLFTTDCFPQVISLNTGAPFNSFNRSPLISYSYKISNFSVTGYLISQLDYPSIGPANVKSADFLRNSKIPNGHLHFKYKTEKHIAGIGLDYKVLRPKTTTGKGFIQDETIGTYAAMAYYSFHSDKFDLKFKGLYGQNLTDQLLIGGFAVKTIDTTTLAETYTPLNNYFVWANGVYGKDVRVGLFAGFAGNLGAEEATQGIFWGRGTNIKSVYRVAPSVSWKKNNTQISAELEYTSVAYGKTDLNGLVQNTDNVKNFRGLLTFFYFF